MKGSLWVAFGCMASLGATAAEASDRSWDKASSILRNAVVVSALGIPAVQGDWTGSLEAGASVGAAFGAAEGLKRLLPERRPDGSNDMSFPSGHTASAFAAAASLQNRYGWEAGLPAQIAAAFVGVARVKARKHHWYDVVAGAALGEASGFLITSRRDDRVKVFPWGDGGGGGLSLAMRF